jgi:hypothetical protein
MTDNIVALNLKGITLAQTSELIKSLYGNEMVLSVAIQTAGNDVDRVQTINISVALRKAADEQ